MLKRAIACKALHSRKGTIMSQATTPLLTNVVAVYLDQAAAEQAVRRLHEEGLRSTNSRSWAANRR